MKGNQIILLAILFVIIAASGFYLYYKAENKPVLPAAFAVPESAVVVYQGNKLEQEIQILRQNQLFKSFSTQWAVDSFFKSYDMLDSVVATQKDLHEALGKYPLVVSLHITGAHSVELLYLLQVGNKINKHDFERFIKDNFADYRLNERKFEETKLYDVKIKNSQQLLSFTFMDGIMAVSKNAVLIEEAISSFNKNTSKNNELTSQLIKHTEENRLFINFKQLPEWLNSYLQPQYHDKINGLKLLSGIGIYETNFQEQEIQLRGTLINTTENQLWNTLIAEKGNSVGLPSVLPSNTAMFMEWSVSNFPSYFQKYKNYLSLNKVDTRLEAGIVSLQDSTGLEFERDIVPLIGNNWGYAVLQPINEVVAPKELMIIKADDTTSVEEAFQRLNEKAADITKGITSPVTYRNYQIYKTNYSGVFWLLFGEMFSSFQKPFYAHIGNYMVFAMEIETIQRAVDAFLDNQTLEHQTNWEKIKPSLASAPNFTMFIDPSSSILLSKRYIYAGFESNFRLNIPFYKTLGCIGYQLVASDKDFYNQLIFEKADVKSASTEMLWSQSLEADAYSQPYIITVANSNEKRILIQDIKKNLYLLNNAGNIIWKKPIDDFIKGDINTVDYYGTGGTQLLFSGENYIHLLDLNGKETGNYPLRLGNLTSVGLSYFDFGGDNGKQYFVPLNDNRIYGFYLSGKPIPRWSPVNIDGRIVLPFKYFSIKGKPFIFSVTHKGKLYVWDLQAKEEIAPIALNTLFKNPFSANLSSTLENTVLFSVDTAGKMYQIRLNGDINTRSFSDFTQYPYFDFFDTNGDGRNEYILSGSQQIAAYEKESKPVWSFKVSSPLFYPPQFVNLENGVYWIGYVAVPENVIYLRSRAGTTYKGFPVRGSKPFAVDDITNDGGLEMVTTGDGAKVYLYRLGR